MTTTARCAHDACLCTRPYSARTQASATERLDPDAEYCSRRCEDAAIGGPHGDGACICGHVECQASADAGIPDMQ